MPRAAIFVFFELFANIITTSSHSLILFSYFDFSAIITEYAVFHADYIYWSLAAAIDYIAIIDIIFIV